MSGKKPIEFDYLFIYEHKVRELENICLMKYELDRRGYRTHIIHIEDEKAAKAVKPIYHAKVIVMMACYGNDTMEWHTKRYVKFEKAIDLQWENIIYPMDEKNSNAFKNYSGIGKEVVRVSWGEANRRRMLDVVGMDPEKIKVIGHVGMDFLRDELRGYYLSKEELLQQYDIDVNKKIYLFASPFFSDTLDESYLNKMCTRFGEGWRQYYFEYMLKSKAIILEWISKVCESRKDIVFIYRPHPAEISYQAEKLEKKLDNFRVIGDKSIKQWIVISDKVYTGNSSTFVEAFLARKMCYMIFPIEPSEDYELEMIKGADKIKTFEAFEKSIFEVGGKFPIKEELIDTVYSIDWEKPSYVKFADMAEEVLSNPYYTLTKESLNNYRVKQGVGTRIIHQVSKLDCLYNIYLKLLNNEKIQWKLLQPMRDAHRKIEDTARNLAFEQTNDIEVQSIVNRIAEQLDNKDL